MLNRSMAKYKATGKIAVMIEQMKTEVDSRGIEKSTPATYKEVEDFVYMDDYPNQFKKEVLGRFNITGSNTFISVPEIYEHLIARDNSVLFEDGSKGRIIDFEVYKEEDSKSGNSRGFGLARLNNKFFVIQVG